MLKGMQDPGDNHTPFICVLYMDPFHLCSHSLKFLRVKVPLLNIHEDQERNSKLVASMLCYFNAYDIPSVRAKVSRSDYTLRKTKVLSV